MAVGCNPKWLVVSACPLAVNAALCVAVGQSAAFTAALANLGGGLVCEQVGVVPIEKQRLLEEAQEAELR